MADFECEKYQIASSAGQSSNAPVLAADPFQNPPPFEKLVGDLAGAYSRRLTIGDQLVYEVLAPEKTVRILRIWMHYE
jgi:Txe/YoeB family toxin of toxin-antitoxin system